MMLHQLHRIAYEMCANMSPTNYTSFPTTTFAIKTNGLVLIFIALGVSPLHFITNSFIGAKQI